METMFWWPYVLSFWRQPVRIRGETLESGKLFSSTSASVPYMINRPRNKSLDNITQVDVNGSPIPISDSIKLLGVTIDSLLAFNKHVSLICQSCQYHIRALRHNRPILDANTARLVGHALVSSRLDYANSIMYGMSKSLTAKAPAPTKHVGPRRFANESFEQCRTTAQRTSLASSGIEDPFQNSYSHTQNS